MDGAWAKRREKILAQAEETVRKTGICTQAHLQQHLKIGSKAAKAAIEDLAEKGILEPVAPDVTNGWARHKVVDEYLTDEGRKAQTEGREGQLAEEARRVRERLKKMRQESLYLRKTVANLLNPEEMLRLGAEKVNLLLDAITAQELSIKNRASLLEALADDNFKQIYDRLLFDRLDMHMPGILEKLIYRAEVKGDMSAIKLAFEYLNRRPIAGQTGKRPAIPTAGRTPAQVLDSIKRNAAIAGFTLKDIGIPDEGLIVKPGAPPPQVPPKIPPAPPKPAPAAVDQVDEEPLI